MVKSAVGRLTGTETALVDISGVEVRPQCSFMGRGFCLMQVMPATGKFGVDITS